jgi:FtsP/CotA-like multicopper oxidase with cupredoxin domain
MKAITQQRTAASVLQINEECGTMSNLIKRCSISLIAMALFPALAHADAFVQCPGDNNADAIPDVTVQDSEGVDRDITCMHLSAGDGFVTMADGSEAYIFGFADLTGVPANQAIDAGLLSANFPAPSIVLDEGEEFFLTVTNTGMVQRPDLFDPHTVHFHGFPQASDIFDGVPDATISVNGGTSLTYYYNIVEPGTYMYHCHVEATEHMQMGMLGNLYVRPRQDGTPFTFEGETYTTFAYNDGDGSTGYDQDHAIQIGSFDLVFHNASRDTQPLPFANMKDDYAMLNGRGYPETTDPATDTFRATPGSGAGPDNPAVVAGHPVSDGLQTSQPITSVITATAGERILLRLSNLNVTNNYTVGIMGMTMQVVGNGARLLRGNTGRELYYETNSITLGGGEAMDVILDTTGIPSGTYFLYTTNLNYLSNGDEDFGGMMTEITVQ